MTLPSVSLPAALTVALPLIVAFISGILGQQKPGGPSLPSWLNALIVGGTIIGASILAMALGSGLGSNWLMTFVLFVSYCSAVIASPVLKPLLDTLLANVPSPLGFLAKPAALPPAKIVQAKPSATQKSSASPTSSTGMGG